VLSTGIMLVLCVAYSLTLEMEATCSSEMSVDFHRTIVHGVSSKKIDLFITTAVRTSSRTSLIFSSHLCLGLSVQYFNVVLFFIIYIALLFKLNFSEVNSCCAFLLLSFFFFLPGAFSLILQPLNFYLYELSPLTAD
jgi:hypothetical protein